MTEDFRSADTPEGSTAKQPLDVRFLVRGGFAVLVLGGFAIFVLQNLETVNVEFLWWSFDVSRVVLLLGSALIGIVIWELVGAIRRRRQRRTAVPD